MAPGLMELKPLGFAQLVYQIAIAEARCLQQLVPQGGPQAAVALQHRLSQCFRPQG